MTHSIIDEITKYIFTSSLDLSEISEAVIDEAIVRN